MLKHLPVSSDKNRVALKIVTALTAATLLTGAAAKAQVGTIDTFSTTLAPAYTKTTILDNDTTRNVTFATNTGILQSTATTTAAAEQTLLLRSDFTLGIGQILRVDIPSFSTGSQDFGIALSSTATPTGVAAGVTGDTRTGASSNYFFAGFRSTQNHFLSGGFNGGVGLATLQAGPGTGNQVTLVSITGLYISRTSATTFDVGYDDSGGADTLVGTYTFTSTAVGAAVGFYSDQRAAATIGNLDNLRITSAVPEPSTWAMLAAGIVFLGLTVRTRRA